MLTAVPPTVHTPAASRFVVVDCAFASMRVQEARMFFLFCSGVIHIEPQITPSLFVFGTKNTNNST